MDSAINANLSTQFFPSIPNGEKKDAAGDTDHRISLYRSLKKYMTAEKIKKGARWAFKTILTSLAVNAAMMVIIPGSFTPLSIAFAIGEIPCLLIYGLWKAGKRFCDSPEYLQTKGEKKLTAILKQLEEEKASIIKEIEDLCEKIMECPEAPEDKGGMDKHNRQIIENNEKIVKSHQDKVLDFQVSLARINDRIKCINIALKELRS